jgi:hypothetical protein
MAVPREKMSKSVQKIRDFYEKRQNSPFYQCEFGFFTLDKWKSEGYIDDKTDIDELFGFDKPATHSLGQLGWCNSAFFPEFEEEFIEDRGSHEVIRDTAGRSVLYFKGRRSGFMPEYLDHPVKDIKTWEENCRWRLDPKTAGRYADIDERMDIAGECAEKGMIICQDLIGGYMYLRSLIGPLELLYKFHDDPGLIHRCMETWFELADAVIARHQEHMTLDELYLAEDICYNHGPLIAPDMIRGFLFPYYSQLIENIKKRQIDKTRHLYIQIDTDGYAVPVIDVYKEIGMDHMSPFEAASGCDVVSIGAGYPGLLMRGGFDKRVLSQGKDQIDRLIGHIMPIMQRRGGYIPMCDHGVPEEVSFENYMHFRKRMLEY